jgi:hypothetical protein
VKYDAHNTIRTDDSHLWFNAMDGTSIQREIIAPPVDGIINHPSWDTGIPPLKIAIVNQNLNGTFIVKMR